MSSKWLNYRKDRVEVYAQGVPSRYLQRVHGLVAVGRKGLTSLYGLSIRGRIEVILIRRNGSRLRLWTNGKDTIYLTFPELETLRGPHHGGAHHVYGLCHELAHIAMYSRIRNISGLAEGWGEGWAHYVASTALVPYAWSRLGADAWPEPYPFLKLEGPDRFHRQLSSAEARRDPTVRVAAELYRLEQRHGRRAIGRALRQCETDGVPGDHFVSRFRSILRRAV